jgi:hypothetical protein
LSVFVGGGAVTIALGNTFGVKTKDEALQDQLDRLGVAMLDVPESIRRSIQKYLPFAEYINECIFQKPFSVTLWHERTALSATGAAMDL